MSQNYKTATKLEINGGTVVYETKEVFATARDKVTESVIEVSIVCDDNPSMTDDVVISAVKAAIKINFSPTRFAFFNFRPADPSTTASAFHFASKIKDSAYAMTVTFLLKRPVRLAPEEGKSNDT